MPLLVSVIVPTYNRARYLPEAIQSILGQSYPNIELLVVDDGSTDDTAAVVQSFSTDPRVRYLYQNNQGKAHARNTGIKASSGDFIALCDSDDIWMPQKLELQIECFEKYPEAGVVYTGILHVDEANQEVPTYQTQRFNGWVTPALLQQNFVTGCTSMIRKECFEFAMYDETLHTCEDYDLWLRLSTRFRFQFLDVITYRYRQWGGQISNPKNELTFFDDSARVRQKFLGEFGATLDKHIVDRTWGGYHSARAQCIMRIKQRRMLALHDILLSIKYCPLRFQTWKNVLKVLTNRVW